MNWGYICSRISTTLLFFCYCCGCCCFCFFEFNLLEKRIKLKSTKNSKGCRLPLNKWHKGMHRFKIRCLILFTVICFIHVDLIVSLRIIYIYIYIYIYINHCSKMGISFAQLSLKKGRNFLAAAGGTVKFDKGLTGFKIPLMSKSNLSFLFSLCG